jgi:hypothetical protein
MAETYTYRNIKPHSGIDALKILIDRRFVMSFRVKPGNVHRHHHVNFGGLLNFFSRSCVSLLLSFSLRMFQAWALSRTLMCSLYGINWRATMLQNRRFFYLRVQELSTASILFVIKDCLTGSLFVSNAAWFQVAYSYLGTHMWWWVLVRGGGIHTSDSLWRNMRSYMNPD